MLSSFEIFSYKLPSRIGKRRGLFIRLTQGDGRFGVGEIAPLPGVNFETLEEALVQTKKLREKFLQKEMSPLQLLPSVHFGLASALRQLSIPSRDLSFKPIQLLHNEKGEEQTPHLNEIKCKIGHLTIEEAVKRSALLLEQGMHLRLDINGRWDLEKSVAFCTHFSPKDFVYIEDPVASLSEFEPFYERSGFSFAVDSLLRFHPLETVLSLKGLSHLIIKPMVFGGFERLQEIQKKAKQIPLVFSNTYETTVGLLHTIELANSLSPKEPIGIDPVVETPFFASSVDLRGGFVPSSLFEKTPILFSRLTKVE